MAEIRDAPKRPLSLPHEHPDSNKLRIIPAETFEVYTDTDLGELVINIVNKYERSEEENFGCRILFSRDVTEREPLFETTLTEIFQEKVASVNLRKATYIHDDSHCGIFIAKPSVYNTNSISDTFPINLS